MDDGKSHSLTAFASIYNSQSTYTMTRISTSLLLFTWIGVTGFEGIAAFQSRHGRMAIPTRQCGLYSTAGDDNGSLRRALEESWNTSKMGRVPIDPEAAAKEAYSSILQAAGGTRAADGETPTKGYRMRYAALA